MEFEVEAAAAQPWREKRLSDKLQFVG